MGLDIVDKIIAAIIGIIVIFAIIAGTATDLTDSATNVSTSGLPLASLFGPTGVVLLVFMAAILIGILAFLKFKKSRS